MNPHNGAMEGKVVLVTGGTSGIGKATAEGLANLGARVVLVGRDRSKGEVAAAEIKATTGNEAVELMVADLSSQAEIHRLASEFEANHDRLDALVNNAGAMYARRWETEEGIEGTLAVVHLAPVLLSTLLLPMLQSSAPSRVVNVSSWSHRRAKLDLDDLQMREHYNASTAYSRAKLINAFWTYELARRLEGTGVTVNLADPGGASTQMTRSETMPLLFRTINRLGQRFMTTEKAARSSIYLASSPEVEGVSGGYFEPPTSGSRVREPPTMRPFKNGSGRLAPSSRSWIGACRSKERTERCRSGWLVRQSIMLCRGTARAVARDLPGGSWSYASHTITAPQPASRRGKQDLREGQAGCRLASRAPL